MAYRSSELSKLMKEKSNALTALYDTNIIRAGDTVRITRVGVGGEKVTYESLLHARKGGDLFDSLNFSVKYEHTAYLMDNIIALDVVRHKVKHSFYTPNLDRAPVVGDFFNRGGGLYLVVTDTTTAMTLAGIHLLNVSTAVKSDIDDVDSWGTTRKLIRDGATGKLV